MGYRKRSYSLYKTTFEGAHNAESDVEACAKCYFELIKNNVL